MFKNGKHTFFIAEIGVNHNGSLEIAKQLIEVAKNSGADAVKFQTFDAERLATKTAGKAAYQEQNENRGGESQVEMLKRLEFSKENLLIARDYCNELGIKFLSTPFDEEAADLLEEIGVEGFKISSGDLTNLPFLAHVARKKKPMIISTGMANMAECEEAVETIRANGNPELGILHCVSNYPADPKDANLHAMHTMMHAFGGPIGWSDHTEGDAICLAAVALGAPIIEKHFTLDKNMEGPDHKASMEPDELKDLIAKIRIVESALGDGKKRPTEAELDTAKVARRSIVSARPIKAGEVIDASMLVMKRPGTGLKPNLLNHVIGRTAKIDIEADVLIAFEQLA